MPEDSGSVPDFVVVVRGIRPSEIRQDGKIKKSAFVPRRNGKDDDGLSVTQQVLTETRAQLLDRMETPRDSFCELRSQDVRTIKPGAMDVRFDPTEQDNLHCLITGMPTVTEGTLPDDPRVVRINELASALARISTEYTPLP